jgi:hypothetical protein
VCHALPADLAVLADANLVRATDDRFETGVLTLAGRSAIEARRDRACGPVVRGRTCAGTLFRRRVEDRLGIARAWSSARGAERPRLSPLAVRRESRTVPPPRRGIAAVAAARTHTSEAGRLWGAFERLSTETERRFEPHDRQIFERALGRLDDQDVDLGRTLFDDEVRELLQETTRALSRRACPGGRRGA